MYKMNRSLPKQFGYSLIELMLGITLFMIIAIILNSIFIDHNKTIRSVDVEQQLQRTTLYAKHYLSRHVKHGAYFGDNLRKARLSGTALPAGPPNANTSCNNSAWTRNIWQPLTGTNQNQLQYPCLNKGTSLRRLAGDTITVRYSKQFTTKSYSKNSLYTRSSLATIALFLGKDRRAPENNIEPPYTDRKFNSFTFYISLSRLTLCNASKVPALTVMNRSRSGKLRRSVVIAGIEQMQLQYSSDLKYFVDADKVTQWNKIRSCKVWLLVRSLCHYYKRPRYSQLQFADIKFQSNDRYRRKLSSFIVALRNNATN